MLTHERLRELLDYDSNTGICIWLKITSNRIKIGDIAGATSKGGRRIIGIDGTRYILSRIIWFWMTGVWPKNEVDHKDTNHANNKWSNLREANRNQQNWNIKIQKNNESGLKWVSFDKRKNLWCSRVMTNGKQKFLGYFDCPVAAHLVAVIESSKYHGEFTRSF